MMLWEVFNTLTISMQKNAKRTMFVNSILSQKGERVRIALCKTTTMTMMVVVDPETHPVRLTSLVIASLAPALRCLITFLNTQVGVKKMCHTSVSGEVFLTPTTIVKRTVSAQIMFLILTGAETYKIVSGAKGPDDTRLVKPRRLVRQGLALITLAQAAELLPLLPNLPGGKG
tara:strand:+ start:434 stop:952 length:519 start_codon:yes stop_codon:yes gene_type:complete